MSETSSDILDKFVLKLTEECMSEIEESDAFIEAMDSRYREAMSDLFSFINETPSGSLAIYVSPDDDTDHACTIDLQQKLLDAVVGVSTKEYADKIINRLEKIISNIRGMDLYMQ